VKERDSRGRFKPGCKGGPGNPLLKRAAAHRKAVDEATTPKEVKKAIRLLYTEWIDNKDVAAARVFFERVLGKPRPEPTAAEIAGGVGFDLHGLNTMSDLVDAGRQLLEGVADGKMPIDDAIRTAALLEGQRRLHGTLEFEKKIEALERQIEEMGQ